MTLSRDTFGHDEEIGALFEAYDRLVRWEEHNSRLDATDPVVERAVMRGRIVAFIANTATLQQDAHTSIAEPEPQDVEEARRAVESAIYADYEISDERFATRFHALNRLEAAIRADERKRWAEREQQLVKALRRMLDRWQVCADLIHESGLWEALWERTDDTDAADTAHVVLNQDRPA